MLQWRVLLPDSLPAFRRATAAFLDFVASPGAEPISCAPVSPLERAAARAAEASGIKAGGGSSTPATLAVFDLAKGWFEAAASGAGGSGSAAAPAGGYAWQLADRLYSSAQYALAFQLALAPEVGEEEVSELGPEWVRPATLLALQASARGRGGRWAVGWLSCMQARGLSPPPRQRPEGWSACFASW